MPLQNKLKTITEQYLKIRQMTIEDKKLKKYKQNMKDL
jgi:hypothetical protein